MGVIKKTALLIILVLTGVLNTTCLPWEPPPNPTTPLDHDGGRYFDFFHSEHCREMGPDKCMEEAIKYHATCIPSQDGVYTLNGTQLSTKVVDGNVVAEGDMILGSIESFKQSRSASTRINEFFIRKWTGGIIPFQFDDNVPETPHRADLRTAMQRWETETNRAVQFLERNAANASQYPNYVRVQLKYTDGTCSSQVGMLGGEQSLYMSTNTSCPGFVAIHELGHTLGLWHEQTRWDRDEHIVIFWCNIEPEARFNFTRMGIIGVDFGPYDVRSIMHYGRFAAGKLRELTVTGVDGVKQTIQAPLPTMTSRDYGYPIPVFHEGLSAGDILSVTCLYLPNRGVNCRDAQNNRELPAEDFVVPYPEFIPEPDPDAPVPVTAPPSARDKRP